YCASFQGAPPEQMAAWANALSQLACASGRIDLANSFVILARKAWPKKRCLELSSLNKCWSFARLKVPDTFFWAKRHGNGKILKDRLPRLEVVIKEIHGADHTAQPGVTAAKPGRRGGVGGVRGCLRAAHCASRAAQGAARGRCPRPVPGRVPRGGRGHRPLGPGSSQG